MLWFKTLFSASSGTRHRPAGNQRHRARLGLEALENRLTPSANNLMGSA